MVSYLWLTAFQGRCDAFRPWERAEWGSCNAQRRRRKSPAGCAGPRSKSPRTSLLKRHAQAGTNPSPSTLTRFFCFKSVNLPYFFVLNFSPTVSIFRVKTYLMIFYCSRNNWYNLIWRNVFYTINLFIYTQLANIYISPWLISSPILAQHHRRLDQGSSPASVFYITVCIFKDMFNHFREEKTDDDSKETETRRMRS